jgi:hypothetical protein
LRIKEIEIFIGCERLPEQEWFTTEPRRRLASAFIEQRNSDHHRGTEAQRKGEEKGACAGTGCHGFPRLGHRGGGEHGGTKSTSCGGVSGETPREKDRTKNRGTHRLDVASGLLSDRHGGSREHGEGKEDFTAETPRRREKPKSKTRVTQGSTGSRDLWGRHRGTENTEKRNKIKGETRPDGVS